MEARAQLSPERAAEASLLLADIAMPGRDGFEALPSLRAESPDSRVVVLSSFQEADLGRKARDLGAVAYLEKGLGLERLADRLAEIIGSPPQG